MGCSLMSFVLSPRFTSSSPEGLNCFDSIPSGDGVFFPLARELIFADHDHINVNRLRKVIQLCVSNVLLGNTNHRSRNARMMSHAVASLECCCHLHFASELTVIHMRLLCKRILHVELFFFVSATWPRFRWRRPLAQTVQPHCASHDAGAISIIYKVREFQWFFAARAEHRGTVWLRRAHVLPSARPSRNFHSA